MVIEVLARGPSIKNYKPNGNFTVGVNAIFKYWPVNHLLMVDSKEACEKNDKEEVDFILTSKPDKFLCCHPWPIDNFEAIELVDSGRGNLKDLDSDKYCYSITSAFVACIHAYKLGAKKIITHGIDLYGHPQLGQPEQLKSLLLHFDNLKKEFDKREVEFYVSSNESALAKVIPVLPFIHP